MTSETQRDLLCIGWGKPSRGLSAPARSYRVHKNARPWLFFTWAEFQVVFVGMSLEDCDNVSSWEKHRLAYCLLVHIKEQLFQSQWWSVATQTQSMHSTHQGPHCVLAVGPGAKGTSANSDAPVLVVLWVTKVCVSGLEILCLPNLSRLKFLTFYCTLLTS